MHSIVTIIAKYLIGASVLLAGYCWLKLPTDKKKRFFLQAIVGAVATVVLAKIASKMFYNPRPFIVGHFAPYFSHGNDNGFPSDHTLLASFLGFLVLRYNKTYGYILLAFALAIGLARVRAGVHHLIDIIGSFVFAGIGAWIAFLAIRSAATDKK